MNLKKLMITGCAFLMLSQGILAEETDFNWGFKAGTLGLGLDLSKPINNFVSLRLNANGFNYTTTDSSNYSSFIKADKEYKLQTIGLLVDYHLLQLRVTTGLYINKNTYTETTKPKGSENVYLNNKAYDTSSIVEIESTVTFKNISPYVGVGWGNNGNRKGWGGWNLTLDVGLMYHGDPQLALDVKTNPSTSATMTSAIEADRLLEREIQEKDLSDFPFYPVVMIGANFSF
jgi:hypothetical protein